MKRRELITLLGGGAARRTVPTVHHHVDWGRRLGVLVSCAEADREVRERLSALRDGLNKVGWTQGKNIQIEVRWAAGQPDRMRADASELISIPVDVIVGNSPPLLKVLKTFTQTIPI